MMISLQSLWGLEIKAHIYACLFIHHMSDIFNSTHSSKQSLIIWLFHIVLTLYNRCFLEKKSWLLLSLRVCVFVHSCAYMCVLCKVNACACIPVHMCGDTRGWIQLQLRFWDRISHWLWSPLFQLCLLLSECRTLCSYGCISTLGFNMAAEALTSGCHAYPARPLLLTFSFWGFVFMDILKVKTGKFRIVSVPHEPFFSIC